MQPGSNGSPRERSSSPVEKNATRNRRCTMTWPMPSEASRPRSAGRNIRPRVRAALPSSRSSPMWRRLSPVRTTPSGMVTVVSDALWVNSCGTTVSHLAGITAPVMMRTHSPWPTVPSKAFPANTVPTMANVVAASGRRSAPWNAKPSMAELSCAGTLMGEMTSAASTRSSACQMVTVSIPRMGCTKSCTMRWACATGRALGS
jgi:hypothetical protein